MGLQALLSPTLSQIIRDLFLDIVSMFVSSGLCHCLFWFLFPLVSHSIKSLVREPCWNKHSHTLTPAHKTVTDRAASHYSILIICWSVPAYVFLPFPFSPCYTVN